MLPMTIPTTSRKVVEGRADMFSWQDFDETVVQNVVV
jgi:hypothetical protein